jgi:hypothetical protein
MSGSEYCGHISRTPDGTPRRRNKKMVAHGGVAKFSRRILPHHDPDRHFSRSYNADVQADFVLVDVTLILRPQTIERQPE